MYRNQVLGGPASRAPSYSSDLPAFELRGTSLAGPARRMISEKLNGRMGNLHVIQAQRSTALGFIPTTLCAAADLTVTKLYTMHCFYLRHSSLLENICSKS